MTMCKCVSFYDFSNMNYIIDLTVKNKTEFTNNIKYPRVSLLLLTAFSTRRLDSLVHISNSTLNAIILDAYLCWHNFRHDRHAKA